MSNWNSNSTQQYYNPLVPGTPVSSEGILVADDEGTIYGRSVVAGSNILVSNGTGVDGNVTIDFSAPNATSGQVLSYNGSLWVASNSTGTLDATLQGIAATNPVANQIIYANGTDTFTVTTLTAHGRTILANNNATETRTTLGLGTIATESSATFLRVSNSLSELAATANTTRSNIGAAPNNTAYLVSAASSELSAEQVMTNGTYTNFTSNATSANVDLNTNALMDNLGALIWGRPSVAIVYDELLSVGDGLTGHAAVTNGNGTVSNFGSGGSRPGVARLDTGNTTTGRASLISGLGYVPGTFRHLYETAAAINQVSTDTQAFNFYAGFVDAGGSEPTLGAYFRYTHNSSGGNFEAVCRNGGANVTTANCAVSMSAGSFYRLGIDINSSGTSSLFYINGNQVANVTSNVPTSNFVGHTVNLRKTAGTTNVTADCDYIKTAVIGSTR